MILIITTIITNLIKTAHVHGMKEALTTYHRLCFSPSLSHRQDIPLGHIKGRRVALRVCVVVK